MTRLKNGKNALFGSLLGRIALIAPGILFATMILGCGGGVETVPLEDGKVLVRLAFDCDDCVDLPEIVLSEFGRVYTEEEVQSIRSRIEEAFGEDGGIVLVLEPNKWRGEPRRPSF